MHDYIIVLTISTYDFLLSFLVFLLFCTIFSYFLIYFLSIYHIIMLIFHCGELVIFYKTVFYAQKNQLDDSWFLSYLQNYIHVDISLRFITSCDSWSSPHPISNSQLHVLPHFHLCPIYLVVFKGSYCFRMRYLILRGTSRLDAFSVYPFPTWLPGREPGGSTGTPEVRPSRSSRTKDSSSQISYARDG